PCLPSWKPSGWWTPTCSAATAVVPPASGSAHPPHIPRDPALISRDPALISGVPSLNFSARDLGEGGFMTFHGDATVLNPPSADCGLRVRGPEVRLGQNQGALVS